MSTVKSRLRQTAPRFLATAGLLTGLAVALTTAAPAAAVELGQPTVLSQRGQKLKVAVPFTAARGESTSITRFAVESVSVPTGHSPLKPDQVVLAKAPDQNVLYLRSDRLVTADHVGLVLAVKDGHSQPVSYELTVPPARAALAQADGTVPRAKARPVAYKRKPRAR